MFFLSITYLLVHKWIDRSESIHHILSEMHPLVKVITEGLRTVRDGKGRKGNIFQRLQSSENLSERGSVKAFPQ